MANPHKQALSKNLADMKFMKRRSNDRSDLVSDGILTDKWVVPNVPEPSERPKYPDIHNSYVEFEDLNRLGRFSYNKYNKEVERLMAAYHQKWEDDDLSEGELEDEDEGTIGVIEVAKRYQDLGIREHVVLGKRKRK